MKRNPSLTKESTTTPVHAFATGQDMDDCDEVESIRQEKRLSGTSQNNVTALAGLATNLLAGSSGESGQDDASTPTKAIQALAKQIEVGLYTRNKLKKSLIALPSGLIDYLVNTFYAN